jgi:endonuclease-3
MNRIGIVKTNTPNETDKEIDRIFDIETKRKLHHPLVLFGRYHCTTRKAKCESCKLQEKCNFYKNLSNK